MRSEYQPVTMELEIFLCMKCGKRHEGRIKSAVAKGDGTYRAICQEPAGWVYVPDGVVCLDCRVNIRAQPRPQLFLDKRLLTD